MQSPACTKLANPPLDAAAAPASASAGVVESDSAAASAGLVVFAACESSSPVPEGEGSGAGEEGGGRKEEERRVVGCGGTRQVEVGPPEPVMDREVRSSLSTRRAAECQMTR